MSLLLLFRGSAFLPSPITGYTGGAEPLCSFKAVCPSLIMRPNDPTRLCPKYVTKSQAVRDTVAPGWTGVATRGCYNIIPDLPGETVSDRYPLGL